MRPKPSASASASSSCLSVLAVLLLLVPGRVAAEEGRPAAAPKIGVVDVDKTLDALRSWQETRARLRAEDEAAEKALEELSKEIARVQAELDYFKPGSAAHEERLARLTVSRQNLARETDRLSRLSEERSRAALQAAREEIAKAVREYAAANGFDVVVHAQAALYVAGGCDISLEVAREMNKRYKNGQKSDERLPSTGSGRPEGPTDGK